MPTDKASAASEHEFDATNVLLTDGGSEEETSDQQQESESGTEPESGTDSEAGSESESESEGAEGEEGGEEGGEGARILHLDLEGLFLDLLGLEVDLDEVVLDVDAVKGSDNLLGNLLSGVAGLTSPMSLLGGGEGSISDTIEDTGNSITDTFKNFTGEILDELEISLQEVMTQFIKELVSQLTDSSDSSDGAES